MNNQTAEPGLHLASDRTVAFIAAEYVEFKPETFEGYSVSFGSSDDKPLFASVEEAAQHARDNGAERVMLLSSVDHYESDRKRVA